MNKGAKVNEQKVWRIRWTDRGGYSGVGIPIYSLEEAERQAERANKAGDGYSYVVEPDDRVQARGDDK